MGLFSALSVGTHSMEVAQQAMEVAGHNLANVNTEGYSREKPVFVSAVPQTLRTPGGSFQIGSGVNITEIQRMHDDFLQTQIVTQKQNLGKNEMSYENYAVMETIFNEPSDTGISAAMDDFFNSWQDLSSPNPSDPAQRAQTRVNAQKLIDVLTVVDSQLKDVQDGLNDSLIANINSINASLQKIAAFNSELLHTPDDVVPNSILDNRDVILEELASKINFTVIEHDDRTIDLSMSGIPLVLHDEVNTFRVKGVLGEEYDEVWVGDIAQADELFKSGEMASIFEFRDTVIPNYRNKLNDITSTIIKEVNAIHETGYDLFGNTGISFFTGTDLSDIDINVNIKNNVNYIAASSSLDNLEGNGEIAAAVADLQEASLFTDNTFTISEFYQDVISSLANESAFTSSVKENQESLLTRLEAKKASISGVSIDEEITDLMKYEQAYTASAKFITVINEVLDTLMSIV